MPDLMEGKSRRRGCAQATQTNRFVGATYVVARKISLNVEAYTYAVARTTSIRNKTI